MDLSSVIGSLPVPPTFTARSSATYLVIGLVIGLAIRALYSRHRLAPHFLCLGSTPHQFHGRGKFDGVMKCPVQRTSHGINPMHALDGRSRIFRRHEPHCYMDSANH